MKRYFIGFMTALLVSCAFSPSLSVSAEKPLVIAFRGDAAILDPHARGETVTLSIQSHIYERLLYFDMNLKMIPQLAESWKNINDLTWEFKLKKGVKFQNGEPFNASSAKFSLERAKTWAKSQFKGFVPNYKEIVVVDEHTFRFICQNPEPELPLMLTEISMVPEKYFKDHDDMFLSRNACGAGPYKLVEWVKDDHIKLAYNPNWHGGKVDFEEVLIRPIPDDAARVAGLLSGEIDVCWAVSIPDIPRVERNPRTYIKRCPSQRIIYLMLDVYTDKGGPAPKMQPGLPSGAPNPFKDIRVRRAVAHSINLEEIIKYVMDGSAYPASQVLSNFAPDYNPNIKRPAYDPKLAKKLLAEAGYPNGFVSNFDVTNDAYINDVQVAEAIAAQLGKIGIRMKVISQPKAVFFPKIERFESPIFLIGWGSLSWGITVDTRYNPSRSNRGRFYDPVLERRIKEANREMDPEKRKKLRWEVMRDATETYYCIPLYYQENVNGYSSRVEGNCRVTEYILAQELKKAKTR